MGRQPMTGMDDVQRHAIHRDPKILERKKAKKDCCTTSIAWTYIIGVSLCLTALVAVYHLNAHCYVAIE
jgi:hypothetical protein